MAGRHVISAVAMSVVVGILAMGCSTVGVPVTSATTATTTSATPTGIGPAPRVDHPLDPAQMIAAPCTTLTSDDGHWLDPMPSGNPVPDTAGPSCEWRDPASNRVLRVTWLTTPRTTLSDMYAHWSSYSTWSPFTVGGYQGSPVYPGVFAGKANQDTDVYLAVNDQTLCVIHYDDPRWPHPEGPNADMKFYALDVVSNLTQGQ